MSWCCEKKVEKAKNNTITLLESPLATTHLEVSKKVFFCYEIAGVWYFFIKLKGSKLAANDDKMCVCKCVLCVNGGYEFLL